jgi:hypothetical protein
VAGSCEYGDEPSGSGATELVSHTVCSGWFAHPSLHTAVFPGIESVLHLGVRRGQLLT